MRIAADTHCHTIASTHAYSTWMELIQEAARMDLCALAVTDHASAMPGSPGKWYFQNMTCIPKVVQGVRVLKGMEANVIDYDGTLDFCDPMPNCLDGSSPLCMKPPFPVPGTRTCAPRPGWAWPKIPGCV